MSENVFVLLDDPYAPTRADLQLHPQNLTPSSLLDPSHYRNTFLTLTPPGALEQLLALLRARWTSARHAGASAGQNKQVIAQQLTIDGNIFAIGNDWLVRAGNVILGGNTMKGMLLEVEYSFFGCH